MPISPFYEDEDYLAFKRQCPSHLADTLERWYEDCVLKDDPLQLETGRQIFSESPLYTLKHGVKRKLDDGITFLLCHDHGDLVKDLLLRYSQLESLATGLESKVKTIHEEYSKKQVFDSDDEKNQHESFHTMEVTMVYCELEEATYNFSRHIRLVAKYLNPKRTDVEKVTRGLGKAQDRLSRCYEAAWNSFKKAVEQNAQVKDMEPKDAYRWINENVELDTPLPKFHTWARYLREARRLIAEKSGISADKLTLPDA